MEYDINGAVQLGRELSSARHAASRSLRAVAESARISAGYLQKLERGQVGEPSPKILRRLADALGIDYGRLMELSGYVVPAPRATHDALATRFASASLTEVEEKAVAAFVDHLISQRRS